MGIIEKRALINWQIIIWFIINLMNANNLIRFHNFHSAQSVN